MIMDGSNIQSDLRALRKLYELLKNGGDGMSNVGSVTLDRHTRHLLKNMLDKESQRILKVHAEIIAGQMEASETQSFIQPQQDETSKNDPRPSSNSVKTMVVSQTCETDAGSNPEIKTDNSDTTVRIYNPLQGIQPGFLQEPLKWSIGVGGAENRRKRCRVCQRSTLKKLEAVEETKFLVDSQGSNRLMDSQNQQTEEYNSRMGNSKKEAELISSNETNGSNTEGKKKTEVDFLPEEASKAIEQIDVWLSTLEVRGNLQLFDEKFSAKTRSFISETKNEMNLPCLSLNQYSMPIQPTNNSLDLSAYPFMRNVASSSRTGGSRLVEGQNVRAMVDKIESRNWRMNHMPCPNPNVGNLSFGKDQWERLSIFTGQPTAFSLEAESRDKIFTAVKDKSNVPRRLQTCMPSSSVLDPAKGLQTCMPSGSVLDQVNNGNLDSRRSVILGARGAKPPLNSNHIQLLPDTCFHEKQTELKHKDRDLNNRKHAAAHTASFQQEESQSKTYSSSYSSNWQSSEYSSHDSALGVRDTTPSTSSESGPSPRNRSPYGNSTSYNEDDDEDEVYSSTSGDGAHELASGDSSSCKSYEYSSPYDESIHRRFSSRPSSSGSTSMETGPRKNHKSEKKSGAWERLKDKVAVIFHHHHHHHHHHHTGDEDQDFHRTIRNISLKKHKHKRFEAYGEKAVEKMKKSNIRDRKQQGHFQGLMTGLMRHVRPSKNSKPAKDSRNIGHLAKHGKQNVVKKSHWWKLLKHHRRAKLPKKTQVKLALGKKNTGLKALPKLR